MSELAVRPKVATGVVLLDKNDPPWWRPDVARAIDVELLDLAKPALCVLGQRCPLKALAAWAVRNDLGEADLLNYGWARYHAYAQYLSGMWGTRMLSWAVACGFTATSFGNPGYGDLTAEWKRVITTRRAAAAAVAPGGAR